MSKGARNLVAVALMAAAAFVYTELSREWSDAAFYAGMVAVIAVIGVACCAFVELPKDPYPRLRRPRA
jgi:ABC-type nickel/cobalt efflux system permease component RcnA